MLLDQKLHIFEDTLHLSPQIFTIIACILQIDIPTMFLLQLLGIWNTW